MSQEKIDRYKEEKANRKKNIAKQKRNALIGKIAGALAIVAVIVYIGFSGYRTHEAEKEAELANSELMSMIESMNAAAATATTTSGEGQSTSEGETTKAGEGETTTATEDETTTAAE